MTYSMIVVVSLKVGDSDRILVEMEEKLEFKGRKRACDGSDF